MTVLLNQDLLIDSIKHGRLKPSSTEPLLGLTTQRYFPHTSHAPSLQRPSMRFIQSSDQEFDELLNRRAGLLKFYHRHYGVDWAEPLQEYARRVQYRGKRAGLDRYFRLQSDYIRQLLSHPSPDPVALKPESFDFYCDFGYRDQILQLESLFVIGNHLLDLETRHGSNTEVWKEVQRRIMQNAKLATVLATEWENANDRTRDELHRTVHSANKYNRHQIDEQLHAIDDNLSRPLSGIPQTDWRVIIGDAWDLITALHEVGRFPELGVAARGDSQIDSVLEQDEILDQHQNISSVSSLQHLKDQLGHAAVNCMNLRAFEAVDLPPLSTLSYILARQALWCEVDLLRDIDSPTYSGINERSHWDQNPLGALLPTVILLAEIPTRICWHSTKIKLESDPWGQDPTQVDDFMPAKSLHLALKSSEATLIFERNTNEYPTGVKAHDIPIKKERLTVLSAALGPGCMDVLDAEQAANLTAKWEDCEVPESEAPPIAAGHVDGDSPKLSARLTINKQFQEIDLELETIVDHMRKWGELVTPTKIEIKCTDWKTQRQNMGKGIAYMTDKQWDEGLAMLMALAQAIWDITPPAARRMAPKLAALLGLSQRAAS